MIRPTIDAIETRQRVQHLQETRHRYFSPVEETHYRPYAGMGVRIAVALGRLIVCTLGFGAVLAAIVGWVVMVGS